jgi:transcriptional regulator with XRE-family HTH domain
MPLDGAFLNARSLPKLGTAVRTLRRRRGWSQAELAQAAQVSRQWVVALERGRTEGMELGRLMRVLDALDASLMVRDDAPEALR